MRICAVKYCVAFVGSMNWAWQHGSWNIIDNVDLKNPVTERAVKMFFLVWFQLPNTTYNHCNLELGIFNGSGPFSWLCRPWKWAQLYIAEVVGIPHHKYRIRLNHFRFSLKSEKKQKKNGAPFEKSWVSLIDIYIYMIKTIEGFHKPKVYNPVKTLEFYPLFSMTMSGDWFDISSSFVTVQITGSWSIQL